MEAGQHDQSESDEWTQMLTHMGKYIYINENKCITLYVRALARSSRYSQIDQYG